MRIIQRELLRKWEEIANKYEVSPEVVRNIETSIWRFVRNEMSKGVKGKLDTFKTIYLRYLGTFYVHKGKFKHMNKNGE